MSDKTERGFASPPENLRDRLGGRLRTQVLLRMHRLTLTAVLLGATFVALMLATKLPSINLFEAMVAADPVSTLFQALVGAIITGVTLVVTISQLVLSQELGSVGDQRERMEGSIDFRSRVEEELGVPAAPPEPSAFLRAMAETAHDRAENLRSLADQALANGPSDDDRPSWEEVREYAGLVADVAQPVAEDLDGAQFGTFAVVSAAMDFNYSWRLYLGRRLLNAEDSPLQQDENEDAREELDHLVAIMALFGPAREHIKTLYFEWELINLSRQILIAAGPALLVSMAALLLLDAPSPPAGFTLRFQNAAWFVAGAATIAITPFALLASYMLRIVTVAKLTLAAGPFILRRTNRRHEIDWGA